ncbi:hypothetical protein NCCP2716_25610 [Sporosarcina sp. NCCP-2716]|nr:hypothetical protein NCCP2716_25610 [Sporosarcina sp. NCCP-2716]
MIGAGTPSGGRFFWYRDGQGIGQMGGGIGQKGCGIGQIPG